MRVCKMFLILINPIRLVTTKIKQLERRSIHEQHRTMIRLEAILFELEMSMTIFAVSKLCGKYN